MVQEQSVDPREIFCAHLRPDGCREVFRCQDVGHGADAQAHDEHIYYQAGKGHPLPAGQAHFLHHVHARFSDHPQLLALLSEDISEEPGL